MASRRGQNTQYSVVNNHRSFFLLSKSPVSDYCMFSLLGLVLCFTEQTGNKLKNSVLRVETASRSTLINRSVEYDARQREFEVKMSVGDKGIADNSYPYKGTADNSYSFFAKI